MRKLFLLIAFTGIVGSASATTLMSFTKATVVTVGDDTKKGDDKKKTDEKKACDKDKACCKKDANAKSCSGEKSGAKSCCHKDEKTTATTKAK